MAQNPLGQETAVLQQNNQPSESQLCYEQLVSLFKSPVRALPSNLVCATFEAKDTNQSKLIQTIN